MYIFGYGSLLNSSSRRLTGQTGPAIPVIIHGLIRHWTLINDSYLLSPLAVSIGSGQVNGVLLKVDEHTLNEFDKREAGYQRIEVKTHKVETVEEEIDRTLTIWVYVTENIIAPTIEIPIVQSYVDTVIAGCLEVSENFAQHFVENTKGWHHPLENDRNQPKYTRLAGVTSAHHELIDDLLLKSSAYSN
ncbi:gamma-glutamylcyclotransferase family protein [Vibrio algarum]|uniref:Gamma-glutamylcyclotransferase n=1 Tax=Vibrio algarum TaxID=3020714 RepID=A0ABT4YWY4_9VIBR|nr:gamma-glutamylcyclotransferase family protein [Vibrio sp. KJ40-1]MDB1126097.1 gamma-glutamylcyclotransferase [Vibrio sp. KJ40-1]